MSSLQNKKKLDDALPNDIRMLLTHKDLKGRTPVHDLKCVSWGTCSASECDCPLHRSAGSVDSLIGQIRAIFMDHGRGKEWNDSLGVGNPAPAPIIKQYLSAEKTEQSTLAVTPKKATPLFLDKLTIVSRHISYTLCNPRNSLQRNYVLHRDIAFLQFLAYSRDQAWDLGNLRADQIFWLPEDTG